MTITHHTKTRTPREWWVYNGIMYKTLDESVVARYLDFKKRPFSCDSSMIDYGRNWLTENQSIHVREVLE